MTAVSDPSLVAYVRHMSTAQFTLVTIRSRVRCLNRLAEHLAPTPLLDAAPVQLEAFQAQFSDRAPATLDIYTRHVKAFYAWALDFDHVVVDPSRRLVLPRLRRAVPHPTKPAILKAVFAYTAPSDPLRITYVLAAFAGLRCGEASRLRWDDCSLEGPTPNALVHGKGGHERIVPLLAPVLAELDQVTSNRRGHVVVNRHGGPIDPDSLSIRSHKFLRDLGLPTTLHSMRHYFATQAAQITRDPLLVRDLLGHASVATTERYMGTSLVGAHERLSALSDSAAVMLLSR